MLTGSHLEGGRDSKPSKMLLSGGGAYAGSVSESDLSKFEKMSGFGSSDMYGGNGGGIVASAYSIEKSLFDAGNTSEAASIAAQRAKDAASAALSQASSAFSFLKSTVNSSSVGTALGKQPCILDVRSESALSFLYSCRIIVFCNQTTVIQHWKPFRDRSDD